MINIIDRYCETIIRPLEKKVSDIMKKAYGNNIFSFIYKIHLKENEKLLYNKYIELGRVAMSEYNQQIKV